MSIGTLSARIMMDASGVRSGLGLTRAEMKLTRQAFIDSTSDVQKLETALGTLASAREKGAFADEAAYAAAIAAVRAELDPTVQAQQRVADAVDQTATALQDQIATAGMSAEAIQRYRLQQQGATADQLASVQALQQQAAAAQQQATRAAELAAGTARIENALREEIATRGMSADQIELWRLEQQGANQAALAGVSALQREAQALRQQDAATAAAAAESDRLEEEVEQVAAALRQEAATAGMSADQLALYKLQTQGATAAQVQMVRQLQAQRTAAQQAAGGHRTLAGGLGNVIQGTGGAIPGVSGLTNTLQLGHPVLIAAAVAVAGVAAAYKLARAAVDWYVAGVGNALDSFDQLSKEARTLGTSVQDLREFRFAMDEIAGIDAGSADRQMEKLSKAIGDANAGAVAQSKAFQRLGLDSRALANAGATEAIEAIAGAMDRIPSRTERIRVAQQLFGKDSAALVNFLVAGKQAIDASTDAMRTYGGVISEVDAQQIEATNDAWGRVSIAVAGLTEQAALELAPALQVAAEKVLQLLDPGTTSGASLRMALEAVPPLLTKMIDLADIFIGNFQAGQAAVMGMVNVLVQGVAIADQALAAMVPGREASADLQAWAADYSRQVELTATDAAKRIASGFTGGTERSITEASAKAKAAAAALAGNKPVREDAAGEIDPATAAQQSLGQQIERTTAALREQVNVFDLLSAAIPPVDPLQVTIGTVADAGILSEFEAFQTASTALADSLDKTRDRLAEQIEYWGMDAEAVELAKLAKQGATEQELNDLRALQGRLRELAAQKKSANTAAAGTSNTIEARAANAAGVWDSAGFRAERQAMMPLDRYAGYSDPVPAGNLDRYAGYGDPVPATLPEEKQIPWLEKIARGIEALVAKEGLVVEEVRS